MFTYEGKPLKSVRTAFENSCKRAGIKNFRFHDLRHTAVALAIKEKKHPFEISKMLGHTSIKTTFDVYGHLL